MTVQIFVVLLTTFSAVTSLLTEALKKFLDSLNVKYAANIVVLFVSIIVGMVGTGVYYFSVDMPLTFVNVVYIPIMAIANWLVAMLGYDKVMQAITQISDKS